MMADCVAGTTPDPGWAEHFHQGANAALTQVFVDTQIYTWLLSAAHSPGRPGAVAVSGTATFPATALREPTHAVPSLISDNWP